MLPSPISVSGVYSPNGGSMADYRGRFGGMLQGTRGIKRPASSMTGPIPGPGNRVAGNDTYDNRAVKTVPYAIQVTGRNVPGHDYRSDYLPVFLRDAAIYSSAETLGSSLSTSDTINAGYQNFGGLFNHPYKTSMQAYSLPHLNMVLSALEGKPDSGQNYPTVEEILKGFSYGGVMINQQNGAPRDWGNPREEDQFSREKQINVAKWGQTTVHALWKHDALPGQSCWLIGKRAPREELERKGLLNFNIQPQSTSSQSVTAANASDFPVYFTAWKGEGAPSIYDTHYVAPEVLKTTPGATPKTHIGDCEPGAVIYVGDFEYSIESGTTKQFEKATSNARIAADTGLTKMTVYPGGIKFNF